VLFCWFYRTHVGNTTIMHRIREVPVSHLRRTTTSMAMFGSWLQNLIVPHFRMPHPSQLIFRKVTLPYDATGNFHWHNPSGRTVVLGPTQPLTEISSRDISWEVGGKGGRCVRITFPPSCVDCLETWESQPPETLRVCPGLFKVGITFTVNLTFDAAYPK